MSYFHKETVSVTVSNTADTDYTSNPLNGQIYAIQYVPDSTTPTASTAVVAIEGETNGISYLSAISLTTGSWTKYPRASAVDSTGQTIGATTAYDWVTMPIVAERAKVTITGDGTSDTYATVRVITQGGGL